MARERLSMRKITEVLRLNQEGKLSARTIARSCKLARSTVAEYLRRFRVTGLTWPVSEGMDDEKLEKLLFQDDNRGRRDRRPFPDMVYIREELRRKHVTLQLLWEEYREREPQGYSYSQFSSPPTQISGLTSSHLSTSLPPPGQVSQAPLASLSERHLSEASVPSPQSSLAHILPSHQSPPPSPDVLVPSGHESSSQGTTVH